MGVGSSQTGLGRGGSRDISSGSQRSCTALLVSSGSIDQLLDTVTAGTITSSWAVGSDNLHRREGRRETLKKKCQLVPGDIKPTGSAMAQIVNTKRKFMTEKVLFFRIRLRCASMFVGLLENATKSTGNSSGCWTSFYIMKSG